MEPALARLTTVENVSCLGCGAVYAKPTGRGSLSAHDGCPECTYVGWRPVTSLPRGRFAADPRPRPQQRSG